MKQLIKDLIENKSFDIADYAESHDLYEALDYDGSVHEVIDGMIDIRYYDLRKWAVDNFEYIEVAIGEGLVNPHDEDYHAPIISGQYLYFREQANEAIEEIFTEFNEKAA